MAPTLAFYGDDFTGSIDVLLQLARMRWSSKLYLNARDVVASQVSAEGIDAVGIAGIARSLSGEALDAEVSNAFRVLAETSPQFVQYKACSTADSSPTVGSLGRVLEIGRSFFPTPTVPILFAQPEFGRFTVFGHHFAFDNGKVYRLDRQPTMSNHPSTPMQESDLSLHLSRQTSLPIGTAYLNQYAYAKEIVARLRTGNDAAVVFDALTNDDLFTIGQIIIDSTSTIPSFLIGSGGMTKALTEALGCRTATPVEKKTGAGGSAMLAVSGSRSPQTERQIRAAVAAGWYQLICEWDEESAVLNAHVAAEKIAAGQSVVVTLQNRSFIDNPVERLTHLLSIVATTVVTQGVTRRIAICGGDTSSRIMASMGASSLRILANPQDNLTVCSVSSNDTIIDGLVVALKGGQVGPTDYFEVIRSA